MDNNYAVITNNNVGVEITLWFETYREAYEYLSTKPNGTLLEVRESKS